MSRITGIESFVLRSTEGGEIEEVFVVAISDAEGRSGIGESVAAPRALKAVVEMPRIHDWSQAIEPILLGADPLEARALWDRLYDATFYHGRRGIAIHALSALDMALHDLAAQAQLLTLARSRFLFVQNSHVLEILRVLARQAFQSLVYQVLELVVTYLDHLSNFKSG